jgi:uncharacterized membrane protein required for colicin V production
MPAGNDTVQTVAAIVFGFYLYKRLLHVLLMSGEPATTWAMQFAALWFDVVLLICFLAPAALVTRAAVSTLSAVPTQRVAPGPRISFVFVSCRNPTRKLTN